jgi:hypothetical protein
MDTSSEIFLGFDPGGVRGFGVALLRGTDVKADKVSSVAAAMNWASTECRRCQPCAAGIDSMLFWCDQVGGWRPADRLLRAAYPAARSSVISPNGLYGSMGIGGVALAMRLRQRWPELSLNETHPKVLAYALRRELHRDDDPAAGIAWFAGHSGIDLTHIQGGHELDAVISAWATREGLSRGWTNLATADASLLFPVGAATYLWPDALQS